MLQGHDNRTRIQASELLTALASLPYLDDCRFSIVTIQRSQVIPDELPCNRRSGSAPCQERCLANWQTAAAKAAVATSATVFRCPSGLLHFIISLAPLGLNQHQLIGGGLRDCTSAPSAQQRDPGGSQPSSVAARHQHIPEASVEQITAVADRVHRLVQAARRESIPRQILVKLGERLDALVEVSDSLDRQESRQKVLALLGEALGILFDLPRIACTQQAAPGEAPPMQGVWGLPERLDQDLSDQILRLAHPEQPYRSQHAQLRNSATPAEQTIQSAIPVPLHTGTVPADTLYLLDCHPQQRELSMIRLLVGRAALRLSQLQQEHDLRQENARLTRLLTVGDNLGNGDNLHQEILDQAAQFTGATSGSLMMVDRDGATLRIEAVRGMNPFLARNLCPTIGTGIAGRVAARGEPLLVTDIHRDDRLELPNRPRFKTGSFVCIPLRLSGKVAGVLNLADKANGASFTEDDLQLLLRFLEQSSLLLERSCSREQTRHLEQLAVTDPLTGLYNRRFLEQRLAEELSRAQRQGQGLTLLLIDLDHFKYYNDLRGHLAGDKALMGVGRIIRSSARTMDVATRFGGEEFCVVLPGTQKENSIHVAERIRREIAEESFPGENLLPSGCLTASIGVSSFPEDGLTAMDLLRSADQALYHAKALGRNRIVLSDASLPPLPHSDSEPAPHSPDDRRNSLAN